MDLAHHAATLNSKRGAAFGFARIAQLQKGGGGGAAAAAAAADPLSRHLASLLPKLYRCALKLCCGCVGMRSVVS
jgi:hypothetical protein